ncbi:hypothetical protein Tco_1245009 [Tanacetum coccineum]
MVSCLEGQRLSHVCSARPKDIIKEVVHVLDQEKTAHGGSKNKRPADGSSGRNVATMKTKTANSTKPTQASRLYFSCNEKKQGQCHCRFIPEIRNAS